MLGSIKKPGRIVNRLVGMHHVVNTVIWENFVGYVGEIYFNWFID